MFHAFLSRLSTLALLALSVSSLVACDEPEETGPGAILPASPAPPPPEPEPVLPPAYEILGSASVGNAKLAYPPQSASGSYETVNASASFGRDEYLALIVTEPSDESHPRVQLTIHGAPEVGTVRVLARGESVEEIGVATVSIAGSRHHATGGSLEVTSVSDDAIALRGDIQVQDPMGGEPAALRMLINARHDDYQDAVLEREAAIREQMRQRRNRR